MNKKLVDNIEKFMISNQIDKELIKHSIESKVLSIKDINPLAYYYGIYKDYIYSKVSIADIVGHQDSMINKNNILDNLEQYFPKNNNEKENSYTARSAGMLEYTTYDIIPNLERSFTKEYILVTELDNNKLFIAENGLHRYHLLRVLYLNEKLKNNTQVYTEFLKEKYTIPVKLKKLDFVKTYCHFLLHCLELENNFELIKERNSNYEETGNIVIIYNNQINTFTDEEFINLIKNNTNLITNNTIPLIKKYYETILSFRQFIDEHFNFLELNNKEKSKQM